MAYSIQRAVSDGTLQVLGISIPFFDQKDIVVTIDGATVTNYTWIAATTIRFTSPIFVGKEVVIHRVTDRSVSRHRFSAGSPFTYNTLDEDFLQLLYIAQENSEGADVRDVYSDINMHGYRIRNLANAQDPLDAVNFSVLTQEIQKVIAQGSGPMNNAANVLYSRSPLLDTVTTVAGMFDAMPRSIWELAHWITEKPSTDPNTWDWTPAFRQAAIEGGHFTVPAGEYIISWVSIQSSLHLQCAAGCRFTRKAGTDGAGRSYWLPGAAMFELDQPGLKFVVTGDWVFNGNNTNQTTTEPVGFFVKCYPTETLSGIATLIHLENGRLVSGTSGYVLARGDNYQRRYKTFVNLVNCFFSDTVYGVGRGDPSTPTLLGYSPTYVYAMDYVYMNTHNFHAQFTKPLGVGQYAPTALLGTYYGQDFALSGECIVTMTGQTTVDRMGRGGPGYDGNWATLQNGIGCIDIYGNGESLFIESLKAVDCPSIPARAKASLQNFTVVKYVGERCVGGVQVSPSSTGPAECVVYIGSVTGKDCNMPLVEFTGTSTTDAIRDVYIGQVYTESSKAPANTADPTILAPVRLRNVERAHVGSSVTKGSPQYGVSCVGVASLKFGHIKTRGVLGNIGAHFNECGDVTIESYDIENVNGPGISMLSGTGKIHIGPGRVGGCVDYGISVNCPLAVAVTIEEGFAYTITGLSRGFYSSVPESHVIRCRVGSGVTNPVVTATTVRLIARDNSWQPSTFFGGGTPPTTGTYRQGDRVLNQFQVNASSVNEHVCTVGGSPGTWFSR